MYGADSEQWWLQEDNDPKHRSRKCTQWKEDNSIQVLLWSSMSPDLSPIENVWGIMKMTVASKPRLSLKAFKRLLQLAETLVASMPTRLNTLVCRNGDYIGQYSMILVRLKKGILPSARIMYGADSEQWCLQKDNDPKHRSRKCTQWKEDNSIQVLLWPSVSPDLSPIENVWGIMKMTVASKPRSSLKSLWNDFVYRRFSYWRKAWGGKEASGNSRNETGTYFTTETAVRKRELSKRTTEQI
ncbi:hypothetical protein ILUMI_07259 [Ignelater luminosus]|uniref:Tc1-like transposase DDE domain-containing protein n=1 Tax=Ignelater luminosus TaxID=2038154 RepID=A0A8K0D7S0_IGNLU|nr:hypothetical protein ILUMI_07259 [Ignelater luminosus]